jgi:hypothetical protein
LTIQNQGFWSANDPTLVDIPRHTILESPFMAYLEETKCIVAGSSFTNDIVSKKEKLGR